MSLMAHQVLCFRRWFLRRIKIGIPMTDTKAKHPQEKGQNFQQDERRQKITARVGPPATDKNFNLVFSMSSADDRSGLFPSHHPSGGME